MKSQRKPYLSTTQIILLSFLCVILIGSVLLSMPISSSNGRALPYIDALFTAASATCVTGLVTVGTAASWSVFGQIVILLLIQIGGLGIITFMTAVMLLFNRKIGISDRLLIQDAFNLNTLSGIVTFVKKVLAGTLTVEGIGACFYMLVFVPQFGAKGIWISIFNSVSAFCNAGIDIIGDNSLCDYSGNALITATTAVLIILGGLGYIVLISTAVLLITGTGLTLFFEYDNPLTIANLPLGEKIQASFFQSVTTRTAGFAGVPQEDLTNPTALLSLLLMFIGGSPVGTAGGIKTVTAAVLLSITVSMIGGKTSVSLFGRTISKQAVYKAVAVAVMSFSVILVSTLLVSAVTDAPALDILYETVSATATVGLSRGLTGTLNNVGKIIIISTMYFGRVGPISMAIAFGGKNPSRNIIKNPTEEISIG